MKRLSVTPTSIDGLQKIERIYLDDERGGFARLFCADELKEAGWVRPIAQINSSNTKQRGSVRGLHFQYPPYAEMKLVICMRGAIWDVAVDLRHGSKTFLGWHAEHLSADNRTALLIPEGFAHGFQALSDDVELVYLHSEVYNPDVEGRLSYCDPRLDVKWPLPVSNVSPRDSSPAPSALEFEGIVL